MAEEYITKKQVYSAMDSVIKHGDGMGTLWGEIQFIYPADVHPVRHGRWENSKASFGEMCSECKFVVWWDDDGPHKFNYCPNCGADMREVDNG